MLGIEPYDLVGGNYANEYFLSPAGHYNAQPAPKTTESWDIDSVRLLAYLPIPDPETLFESRVEGSLRRIMEDLGKAKNSFFIS